VGERSEGLGLKESEVGERSEGLGLKESEGVGKIL